MSDLARSVPGPVVLRRLALAAIADIRHGLFHLVWILAVTDSRTQWIASHCTQLTRRFYACVPADAA